MKSSVTTVLEKSAGSPASSLPAVVHNPLLAQLIRQYETPMAQRAPAPAQSWNSREPFGFD